MIRIGLGTKTLLFSAVRFPLHNRFERKERELLSLSLFLSLAFFSRPPLCMALRDRLKLIGGVALVAWAAGLQVRKSGIVSKQIVSIG